MGLELRNHGEYWRILVNTTHVAQKQWEETQERDIAEAAAKVYKLLWEGEYIRADGVRQRVQGDTAKILDAIGLTATQRALVQNYRFMSARIPGTRQVRRSINHLVFSSRVVYGLPVFMTIPPARDIQYSWSD